VVAVRGLLVGGDGLWSFSSPWGYPSDGGVVPPLSLVTRLTPPRLAAASVRALLPPPPGAFQAPAQPSGLVTGLSRNGGAWRLSIAGVLLGPDRVSAIFFKLCVNILALVLISSLQGLLVMFTPCR
jgi:hypothetical protein